MPSDSAMRPLLLLPEMLLFAGGLAALIGGSFLAQDRQWTTRLVACAALAGSVVASAVALAGPMRTAFEGTFSADAVTGSGRILAAFGALMVVIIAGDEVGSSPRESETYALLLFSTAGTLVLAGAADLLVLAVGFLLVSIPLYGLIGLNRTPGGAEATMKAYLMGALFGIVLLLGITLLYGVSGTTSYLDLGSRLATAPATVVAAGGAAVLAGLMFKAGGFPAHFWVPDAAQAAGGSVAAFLTTVPKIGALVATYRLLVVLPGTVAWSLLVAVLAAAGMTLGNLAAYWQDDPRRLLGWSTVSQVGFLLVPVTVAGRNDLALPSLLLYLAGYTVTNLAAFAVTTALPGRRRLESYRGLASAHPWLAGSLLVALLGLLGTPPTAIFVGKLTVGTAAWDAGFAWLTVVLFANTVASLFYYLRWIIPTYQSGHPPPDPTRAFMPKPWSVAAAVVAAVLALAIGIGAGPLWQLLAAAQPWPAAR